MERENQPVDSSRFAPRGSRAHPIYRTPGLEFIPYGAGEQWIAACPAPSRGELVLWRMRPDWHAICLKNPRAWSSPDERRKAGSFRSSGFAKLYLVGRAALRRILAAMLRCPGEQIEFTNDAYGDLELVRPALADPLYVHIAHVGIWLILGISAVPLMISSAIGASDATMNGLGERDRHFRTLAWQSGLSALTGIAAADLRVDVVSLGAANLVTLPDDTRYQTLDLPMQGNLFAAAVLAAPVSTVRAFGWRRW